MAIIKIEGQEFPLDIAITEKNDLLKAALSPLYPSIRNAQSAARHVMGRGSFRLSKKPSKRRRQILGGGKKKNRNDRRDNLSVSDEALRRLVKAPKTVNQI